MMFVVVEDVKVCFLFLESNYIFCVFFIFMRIYLSYILNCVESSFYVIFFKWKNVGSESCNF